MGNDCNNCLRGTESNQRDMIRSNKKQKILKGMLIQFCEKNSEEILKIEEFKGNNWLSSYVSFLAEDLPLQIIINNDRLRHQSQTFKYNHSDVEQYTKQFQKRDQKKAELQDTQISIKEVPYQTQCLINYHQVEKQLRDQNLTKYMIEDIESNQKGIFLVIVNSHLLYLEDFLKKLSISQGEVFLNLNIVYFQKKTITKSSDNISPRDQTSLLQDLFQTQTESIAFQLSGCNQYRTFNELMSQTDDQATGTVRRSGQSDNLIRTTHMKNQFLQTTQFKQKQLFSMFQKAEANVINFLVQVVLFLFKLTKSYLSLRYRTVFQEEFTKSINELTHRENIKQQVLQYFLFRQGSLLKVIMTPLLEKYYHHQEEEDKKNMQVVKSSQNKDPLEKKIHSVPKLDQSLMPTIYDNSIFEISEDFKCHSMFLEEQNNSFEGPDDLEKLVELKKSTSQIRTNSIISQNGIQPKQHGYDYERILKVIKQSQIEQDCCKIPYNQTFRLIIQLIKEASYYKKCLLIEEIDKLIVDIYMFQRPASQIQQFLDVIQAEDSKLEILMYVLYKFQQEHLGKYSLVRDLLYHVKFMIDFDEVLHPKIKFVQKQSYIRFYQILELVVQAQFEI